MTALAHFERIAALRVELASAQDRCRRAGIQIFDAPVALNDILTAASEGADIPPDVLATAVADFELMVRMQRLRAHSRGH
jgi:hypothetical protein